MAISPRNRAQQDLDAWHANTLAALACTLTATAPHRGTWVCFAPFIALLFA